MIKSHESRVVFSDDVTEPFSSITYVFSGLTVEEYDAVIEQCAVKTTGDDGFPCIVSSDGLTGAVTFHILHKAAGSDDEQTVAVVSFVAAVVDSVRNESLTVFDTELVSVINFYPPV